MKKNQNNKRGMWSVSCSVTAGVSKDEALKVSPPHTERNFAAANAHSANSMFSVHKWEVSLF